MRVNAVKIEITTEKPAPGVIEHHVRGEVDMNCSPELRIKLTASFAQHHKVVIVNLAGVDYMDSSGIATLVEGLQWSHKSHNRFVLVSLSPRVKDVFEMTGLLTVFEIYDSSAEALAA